MAYDIFIRTTKVNQEMWTIFKAELFTCAFEWELARWASGLYVRASLNFSGDNFYPLFPV